MSWGLPKLPGLAFSDPTRTAFHKRQSFSINKGYQQTRSDVVAPGGQPVDADSSAFMQLTDSCRYDPSLTYGRVRPAPITTVLPKWARYAGKVLCFHAFLRQGVPDLLEPMQLRIVKIMYFLADDTMTVMEPSINNSGLWQGRMITRGPIPKNESENYHWKDLDVGIDLPIYGKVFHTVSCDEYTKEFMESQGMELKDEEEMPVLTSSTGTRWPKGTISTAREQSAGRRFFEYDQKVLRFECVWDDRDSEFGELRKYELYYFLAEDTIKVKECHDGKGGRDPFPLLLNKMKLPKNWKDRPVTFPSLAMEAGDEEVSEYYGPTDLRIGETIFVLGRRMLLCDCDVFTRNYYRSALGIEQPEKIVVFKKETKEYPRPLPPHNGIGSPLDSLQCCLSMIPKPPFKDVIKYNLNANKYLRYLCEMESVHPEDQGRQFILGYHLADGKININEIHRRNSGLLGGLFLRAMNVEVPESDPDFPTFYTPDLFYIGAVVHIYKHRFRIIGCDLRVYRYQCANPDKFPQDVRDNVRNYHMAQGHLKDELQEAVEHESLAEKRRELHESTNLKEKSADESSYLNQCLDEMQGMDKSQALQEAAAPAAGGHMDYDEFLRYNRMRSQENDIPSPLKGILKTGDTSGLHDEQKVVCFNAPAIETPHTVKRKELCEAYREKEEQRLKDSAGVPCPYPVIIGEPHSIQIQPAETKRAIDCTAVPAYMRLQMGDYSRSLTERARRASTAIGSKEVRFAETDEEHFVSPEPLECKDVDQPLEKIGEENVDFACPHPEPKLNCCDKNPPC